MVLILIVALQFAGSKTPQTSIVKRVGQCAIDLRPQEPKPASGLRLISVKQWLAGPTRWRRLDQHQTLLAANDCDFSQFLEGFPVL
jgi:hypothetical protein